MPQIYRAVQPFSDSFGEWLQIHFFWSESETFPYFIVFQTDQKTTAPAGKGAFTTGAVKFGRINFYSFGG